MLRDNLGAERFVSQAPRLGYAGSFDGLRGIGVIMVLFAHAAYDSFASFAGSVDVFFVVSGFLITTLLLEEDRKRGRINYKQFYARRALRLFPVLYTVLVVTLIAAWIIGNKSSTQHGVTTYLLNDTKSDVLTAGLYVYHVFHPVGTELVGGGAPVVRPLIQLWTLSVEEHFYLIVAVMMSIVIRRRLNKPLIVVFLGAWLFIGAARLTGHVGPDFAWYQRPDGLMMGVVVAIINAQLPKQVSDATRRWLARAVTVSAIILVVVTGIGTAFARPIHMIPFNPPKGGSLHDGLYWGEFGFSVVSLTMAIMVLGFVRCPEHRLGHFLSWRPLREVGRRSYCIYVVHVPLLWLPLVALHGHVSDGVILVGYIIALPIVVELLHRYVEQPALRRKLHFVDAGSSGVP